MKLIETIPLPNGLEIEVWDASRSVAADTVRVDLIIKMTVEIKREYFREPDQYQKTRDAFGPEIVFEYKKERSFVPKESGRAVFYELLKEFKANSLDYISRPDFPSRFVLSKYAEIQKNPYKFQR
jgi:hypothetical protein